MTSCCGNLKSYNYAGNIVSNSFCVDCDGCNGCSNCFGCVDCVDCTLCTDCTDCIGCHKCVNCFDLNGVTGWVNNKPPTPADALPIPYRNAA